jgi:hypothetical protein
LSSLLPLLGNYSVYTSGTGADASPYPVLTQPPLTARPDNETRDWARRSAEKVRTWVFSGRLQFLPWLDNYTEETPEIREHYRVMLRESTLKAALSSKVLGVAAEDISVQAEDDGDPLQTHIARCGDYALRRVKGGEKVIDPANPQANVGVGWGGPRKIAWNILSGGVIDGWSLNESTLKDRVEPGGLLRGKLAFDKFKAKDTRYLNLIVDGFKNVTGVRGTGFNAGKVWQGSDLESFVIYPHFALFESPLGISDFRAAYRCFFIKDTARKLQALGLRRNTTPALKGQYASLDQKAALDEAFAAFQDDNWLTIPVGALVDVMNIATGVQADFDAVMRSCDQEMLVGICGAYLHILEGSVPDGRGDTSIAQDTAELFQWMMSATLSDTVTTQMMAPWVRLNWGDVSCPTVSWGAINEGVLLARAKVDQAFQAIGGELSRKEAYKYYGRQRPVDDADVLRPPGTASAPASAGPKDLLKHLMPGKAAETPLGGKPPENPPEERPLAGLTRPPEPARQSPGGRPASQTFGDFDEAKHPRGQPENKGQFGPGGGGAGKSADKSTARQDGTGGKQTAAGHPAASGLTAEDAHSLITSLTERPPKDVRFAMDSLAREMATMTRGELDTLKKRLGIDAGGTNVQQARQMAEHLLGSSKPAEESGPFLPDGEIRDGDASRIEPSGEMIDTVAHLTPEQKKAVVAYKGRTYIAINESLRGGEPLEGVVADIADNLKEAMAAAPVLKEPTLVYRALDLDPKTRAGMVKQFHEAAAYGDTVRLDSYQSCSLDVSTALGFSSSTGNKGIVFEIAARKGLYLEAAKPGKRYLGENEFLLPHADSYRVLAVKHQPYQIDGEKRNRLVVQLEQVIHE